MTVLTDWAAQDGHRRWTLRTAVAVATPGLVRADRLVVEGEPGDVRELLAACAPPGYRLMGRAPLIAEVTGGNPAWQAPDPPWIWMTAFRETVTGPGETGAGWLPESAGGEITALLKDAYPDSYTWPGAPRVRRWAGIRDASGRLAAVAADGPGSAEVGYLAGVAVRADLRGRGLARRICAFTVRELAAGRGRVGLMVDDWNTGAIGLYASLGFVERFTMGGALPAPAFTQ